MQRVLSLLRVIPFSRILQPKLSIKEATIGFSTLQNNIPRASLLPATTPLLNLVCNFKVKGRLRRRCKACYFVVRKERLYVMCPKLPRHKQMSMKPKPLNTWILTHASQSPQRPW